MTNSPTDTGLKFRWWQALQANPPTWPIWRKSKGLMFAVAMALQGHAHADGTSIFPSAEEVGTLIGAHRNSVDKYRKALVELRMIELVSQGKGTGDASRYRLCEPSQWRDRDAEFDAAMAAPKPAPGAVTVAEVGDPLVAVEALATQTAVYEFAETHELALRDNPALAVALRARSVHLDRA